MFFILAIDQSSTVMVFPGRLEVLEQVDVHGMRPCKDSLSGLSIVRLWTKLGQWGGDGGELGDGCGLTRGGRGEVLRSLGEQSEGLVLMIY